MEYAQDMGFSSREERQHYYNTRLRQVINVEEEVDERLNGRSTDLARAVDSPKPIERRTFYDLSREYLQIKEKFMTLKDLRDQYESVLKEAKDVPKMVDSPDEWQRYCLERQKLQGDSEEKMEKIDDEASGLGNRLRQIPIELKEANMPIGTWIRDAATNKGIMLDRVNGDLRIEVEDWETIRKRHNPTNVDRVDIFLDSTSKKIRGVNYKRFFLIKDRKDNQIVALPTGILWGFYGGILWLGNWLIF